MGDLPERQQQVAALHARVFATQKPLRPPVSADRSGLSDRELIDRAEHAANGSQLRALMQGDTTGYPSQSEADLALCRMLAFWSGHDRDQMDRIFRGSGLFRPKWNERRGEETYGEWTIGKAISLTASIYSGRGGLRPQAAMEQANVGSKGRPSIFTAADLAAMDLRTPIEVVPGILYEGFSLLAGPPKIGKSWLAQSIAVAVATGGQVFGEISVRQGDALYLGLEDGPVRMRDRLQQMGANLQALRSLHIATAWPRLDEGGLGQLADFLAQHADCRVVIIDTLGRIRPKASGRGTAYQEDTEQVAPLQALALERHVAVVAVHHLRKMPATDPLDQVSGSTGLTGVADTVLILKRGRGADSATLTVTGRDIPEAEHALSFRAGIWGFEGGAHGRGVSPKRQELLTLLGRTNGPMALAAIVKGLGKSEASVKMMLTRACDDRTVVRVAEGYYALPDRDDE